MKQKLKVASLTVSMLGVLGLTTSVAFAQGSADNNTTASAAMTPEQKTMQALAAKTEALEKELIALQKQIAEMKKAQTNSDVKSTPSTMTPAQKAGQAQATANASQPFTASSPEASVAYPDEPISVHAFKREKDEISPQARYYPTALTANGKILTYIAGTPVVASPYLGQRPAFDGSDLIIAMSKINQDLRLMEQRDMIENQYKEEGYPAPNTPIVMLSGTVQPLFTYQKPFSGPTSGNMTLDTAELDTTAIINPWVEGIVSFVYDSAPPAQGGDVTSNSGVSVDKAFVNVGNLSKTPFYATAGQTYVPFGQYSSYMVSGPITSTIGKTQVRAFMAGYAPREDTGVYGTLFTYNSDATLNSTGAGGGNLVYMFGNEKINGNIGGSLISNIGDSNGMQDTGGSNGQFGGFGSSTSTEEVAQIPGYDIHGVLNMGHYSFIGEFVSATKAFDSSALSYNGNGAQPQALQAEGVYTFNMLHKPAALAIGYGWSGEALALQVPQQRYSATLNVTWWRDTLAALEYRHDINYGSSDYAGGAGSTANTTGTGTSADTISALFAVYF